jgi:hypothetical protein
MFFEFLIQTHIISSNVLYIATRHLYMKINKFVYGLGVNHKSTYSFIFYVNTLDLIHYQNHILSIRS